MGNKFIYMSNKSLERVLDWASKNKRTNTLAAVYIEACEGVGELNEINETCWSVLSDKRKTRTFVKLWDMAVAKRTEAIKYRDTIGRLILKEIKGQPLVIKAEVKSYLDEDEDMKEIARVEPRVDPFKDIPTFRELVNHVLQPTIPASDT